MKFTLQQAREPSCLLFECISGSKAYGTDTPESDTDLRGVFVAPQRLLFGFDKPDQISDEANDETYYEIGRFVDLLCRNNPNILEILYSAEACTRFRHPLFDRLRPEKFLSRLCESTFGGYAITQVRKARGLNKKIGNPVDRERKTLFDFCHVLQGQGSIPVADWLVANDLRQTECGLVNIPHMRDVYGIYVDREGSKHYRGILTNPESTMVACSSVSREAEPAARMSVNIDGFKKYCRNYREYWDWVEKRNDARYRTNVEHDRGYDSKNMMHTLRLLDVAREIATEKRITLLRPNRDWLLRVRNGEFEYEELLQQAEARIAEIAELFAKSDLPDAPDRIAAEQLLVEIRERFYETSALSPRVSGRAS